MSFRSGQVGRELFTVNPLKTTGARSLPPATAPVRLASRRGLSQFHLSRATTEPNNRRSNFAVATFTTMAPLPGAHDMSGTSKRKPTRASPSASVILVSPSNEVLLLHRVQTSSSFPSAHVFPGGNLSPSDGPVVEDDTEPARHQDNLAYRTGAIRELFEESGILLARRSASSDRLIEVSAGERLAGRRAIHGHQVSFATWLHDLTGGTGVLDTDALIPFTHWVTPPNVPRRYTTQMYVYFVPLEERGNESIVSTSDDIETMDAEWAAARTWLDRSRRGEIILFPPQFMLLYLVSEFLDADGKKNGLVGDEELVARRERLRRFIETEGDPPWKDKFISPVAMGIGGDGRQMLALDKPGPELKDSGLRGEMERVVLVKFRKEGPRQVEVGWRKDVVKQARENTRSKI